MITGWGIRKEIDSHVPFALGTLTASFFDTVFNIVHHCRPSSVVLNLPKVRIKTETGSLGNNRRLQFLLLLLLFHMCISSCCGVILWDLFTGSKFCGSPSKPFLDLENFRLMVTTMRLLLMDVEVLRGAESIKYIADLAPTRSLQDWT